MPPANVDATIILLDIGKNVAVEDKDGKSFFANARSCVARIIERKIISRPKDLVTVILMGSKRTNNNLANCTDDFRNIEYMTTRKNENNEEVVSHDPPTWDLLKKLPEKPTKYEADWFEGLIVAADAFKNGLYGTKVTNKKIVLMTNFKADVNFGDNLDKVIEGFQAEEFEVDVIGPDLDDSSLDKDTLQVVGNFIEATNGHATTFDGAMRYLLFHRKKATKPMPWNVDLSIGPNIKIPISAYGRIRDEKVIGSWQKAYRDPVTETASNTEGIYRKKDYYRSEDNAPIDQMEVVTGYYYGQKVVPFSDTDKTMLYESGPRGLQIYGFTDAKNIEWQTLAGNGVSYIFGRKGDQNAQKALLCLTRALHESNLVGIARRVYNSGNAPVMHALIPTVDIDNYYCLSAVALHFRDDIKGVVFPTINLKKYEPSNQEVDAFKELIDSMDLMQAYDKSYDDREAFPVVMTVNPSVQYVLDCLAFRAVHPGEPLPSPREDILAPFKPPEPVERRADEPLEKLMKLLNLKAVEKKPKKARATPNVPSVTADTPTTSDVNPGTGSTYSSIHIPMDNTDDVITNIGTVDPIGDFRTLKNTGKSFKDLVDEITAVVENLIYLNFDDDYSKATETIKFLREECVKGDPIHYNDWLKRFKTALMERGKQNILQILQTENLNLIVKEENELSSITKEELDDDHFVYEMDTMPNTTELTIQSDVYAMFDEM